MVSVDLLQISAEPVDISSVYAALADPLCGAQLVFVGVVREENDGRKVSAVRYEAFSPMADIVFKELAAEARARIGSPLRVVILHRVGTLQVGEVSTVIGVASAHRAESYEASRFLIEQLKVRAPIWKEEHYVNGDRTWLDGTELVAKSSSSDPGRREVVSNGAK